MLELGTLRQINHNNSLQNLENSIETNLELFEQIYGNDKTNSIENGRAFELIQKSIRKCLNKDPQKRPDFIQLFGENIRDTMEMGKIKFFAAVKEKRVDELENINWEEAKKENAVNSEETAQLKKDLMERNIEIMQLKEENRKLWYENELLRDENKKLLKDKDFENSNQAWLKFSFS